MRNYLFSKFPWKSHTHTKSPTVKNFKGLIHIDFLFLQFFFVFFPSDVCIFGDCFIDFSP